MTPEVIAIVIGLLVMALLLLPNRKWTPAKRKVKTIYTSNGWHPSDDRRYRDSNR